MAAVVSLKLTAASLLVTGGGLNLNFWGILLSELIIWEFFSSYKDFFLVDVGWGREGRS